MRGSSHWQTAFSTKDYASACYALSGRIIELIPGHHVYDVQNELLPKGFTFRNGTFDYAEPVRDLPELCRFGAFFNTSSKSSVKFEIWM
jgi:feruloyl esterase